MSQNIAWTDYDSVDSTELDGTVEAPTPFDRTLTIPANAIYTGDVLRLWWAGECTVLPVGATGSAALIINGTISASAGSFTFGVIGDVAWLYGEVVFEKTGTSGAVTIRAAINGLSYEYWFADTPIPNEVDTTAPITIEVQWWWNGGTDDTTKIKQTVIAAILHRGEP